MVRIALYDMQTIQLKLLMHFVKKSDKNCLYKLYAFVFEKSNYINAMHSLNINQFSKYRKFFFNLWKNLKTICDALQMQNSGSHFLGLAGIPEVLSKITAGSSGDIHFRMVFISALRTFPFTVGIYDNLTVISAYMTIIGFCIKFRILNIFIYITDNFCKRIQIVPHVRYLNIGDSAAGRNCLELAFKPEFAERINFLTDIHMVRVGIISLVCDIFNCTKPFFINPRKPIA